MKNLQCQIKRSDSRICPCCSYSLLRHLRHQKIYWFCRRCWQEMPLLEEILSIRILQKNCLTFSRKDSLKLFDLGL